MPLIQKRSKKAFDHNVKAEMDSGKGQPQSLAIAYSVKRKPKKMASGGMAKNDSAKSEERPMPDESNNDSEMVSKNRGNKAPKDDQWTDNPTVKQSQKLSITKLSQPKIMGSDAFSVRNMNMRDDENDLGDSIPPETDRAQPIQRDNEDGPNRRGPQVRDMAAQHNNKKAPYNKAIEDQYAQDEAEPDMKKVQSPSGRYAKGGPVMEPKDNHDESEERMDESDMMDNLAPGEHGEQPASWRDELDADSYGNRVSDMEREHSNGRMPYADGGMADGGMADGELDEEHHDSIAAAIMAKRDRMHALIDSGSLDEDHAVHGYADGGEVDLDFNSMEQPNAYYGRNEDDVLKENYDSDMKDVSQPEDSNEHGHEIDSDDHDMIDQIRSKMKSRRQF
jgi:hypothetical protein